MVSLIRTVYFLRLKAENTAVYNLSWSWTRDYNYKTFAQNPLGTRSLPAKFYHGRLLLVTLSLNI